MYVPADVSPDPAVRALSVPPSDIPLMVELDSPALSSVPDSVGVNVNAPAVGTIVRPSV